MLSNRKWTGYTVWARACHEEHSVGIGDARKPLATRRWVREPGIRQGPFRLCGAVVGLLVCSSPSSQGDNRLFVGIHKFPLKFLKLKATKQVCA